MIELVFAVCMIDQPSRCKDVHLNFEAESVSAHECMTNGQFEMAKWAGDNPNWAIQNWHCGIAGQVAKI